MVGGVVTRTGSIRGRSSSARAKEPSISTARVRIANRESACIERVTLAGSVSFCGGEIRGVKSRGGDECPVRWRRSAMILQISYLKRVAGRPFRS